MIKNELSNYDKLYNSILCLTDLMQRENVLVEKDLVEECALLAAEKDFLVNSIVTNKETMFVILDRSSDVKLDIPKKQKEIIKEAALNLFEISKENARLIAKRLNVINIMIGSMQRVAKTENNVVSLYGASGKNLNVARKIGHNHFNFTSTI